MSATNCGTSLPHPAYAPQQTAALHEVGRPVPPARIEVVPARPAGGSLWVDGEWGWNGSSWAWTPGRWVDPPPGARFAPWTTTRDPFGDVYYAPGVWLDPSGRAIADPKPLAFATSSSGPVPTPNGGTQETSPEPVVKPGSTPIDRPPENHAPK